jgi:hypothetical protein
VNYSVNHWVSEWVSQCNDYQSLEDAIGANSRNVVFANYTPHSWQYHADFYYSIMILRVINGGDYVSHKISDILLSWNVFLVLFKTHFCIETPVNSFNSKPI